MSIIRKQLEFIANISKGYMRIMNFVKLSDKVLNPFEYRNGVGQMLEAAVERKQEPEEVAALSFLLKNGFVSVKEGKLSPEFATISYADYKAVKDKLSDGINRMAELIAQHRDMAGEELRKKTPAAISTANELVPWYLCGVYWKEWLLLRLRMVL